MLRTFIAGGCRLGPPCEKEVLYCPDCRAAETQWKQENPDFNDPSQIFHAVQTDRRDIPDSIAKQLLKQSQLDKPERAGRFLWIVYRLNLEKTVAYTLLPNTQFGDSEALTCEVANRRAMDGTLYTYVKSKSGRRRLTLPLKLSRMKGLELRAFVQSYFASKIRLTDHSRPDLDRPLYEQPVRVQHT